MTIMMNPLNFARNLASQPDKRKHALMSGVASVFGALVGLVASRVSYAMAAWLTGVASAVGYELLQAYRREGEPSKGDAIAGIIGATAVAAVLAGFEFVVLR